MPGGAPGEGVARFHMRDSLDNVRRATGSTRINDGKWHYLTGVWDGTSTKLYVDGGDPEATVNSPPFTGDFTSTEPLTIGAYDQPIDYYLNGTLDEAAVYSTALSKPIIDGYIGSCNSFPLSVGDVTFDTSMNVPIPITSGELLANSPGTFTLSSVDISSDKDGTISGSDPSFTYAPDTDYVGSDFFTFLVSNGPDTARATARYHDGIPSSNQPGTANGL